MGRRDNFTFVDKKGRLFELTVTDNAPPMRLSRVRMSADGCYDSGGAYWGQGDPLYYYENSTGDINGYVRGKTREAAKTNVKVLYPHARFYR
jgi:hypothetical protein